MIRDSEMSEGSKRPQLTKPQITRLRALAALPDDDLIAYIRHAELARASTQTLYLHGLVKLRPSDYQSAKRHAFITPAGREWLRAHREDEDAGWA